MILMNIGVSTASLYPLHIEDAFAKLAELGVRTAETFANSTSEAREPYLSQICGIRDKNNMNIVSYLYRKCIFFSCKNCHNVHVFSQFFSSNRSSV